MLIACKECNGQVSDKAESCPHCGCPVKYNKRKPRMRLPNGFGQISFINQNIRNPYRAMVTVGKDEKGRPICKLLKPQAYFKTYNEAYSALLEYNKSPYELTSSLNMNELFEKWFEEYSKKIKPGSSERTIRSAWSYCKQVYEMRPIEIRARHIKGCMEDSPSPNISARIKSVFNLMLDYALEYELVEKNYARTFKTSSDIFEACEEKRKNHIAFTDEELELLWKNQGSLAVDMVLVQCYTGFRPKELCLIEKKNVDLEKNIIVGGIKTKAGTNRTVPIHPEIREIVEKYYKKESCMLFSEVPNVQLTYDVYRRRFEKLVSELNINPEHRLHDPRKTFITLAKKYNVDEYAIKKIVGHTISDITEAVYTDRNTEWLHEEIKKIKVGVNFALKYNRESDV